MSSSSEGTSSPRSQSTLERRTGSRFDTTLLVRYGAGTDELASGELTNMSTGGLGLTGEKHYPVGTEIVVRFRANDAANDLLSLRAKVRHATQKQMGLEFLNIRLNEHGRILDMIQRLTARQLDE